MKRSAPSQSAAMQISKVWGFACSLGNRAAMCRSARSLHQEKTGASGEMVVTAREDSGRANGWLIAKDAPLST